MKKNYKQTILRIASFFVFMKKIYKQTKLRIKSFCVIMKKNKQTILRFASFFVVFFVCIISLTISIFSMIKTDISVNKISFTSYKYINSIDDTWKGILLYWLFLLCLSWFFSLISTIINKTHISIHKNKLKNIIVHNINVRPFIKDYYYTIHQFMFFPLVFIFFMIVQKNSEVIELLTTNSMQFAHSMQFGQILANLTEHIEDYHYCSENLWFYIISLIVGVIGICHQITIYKARHSDRFRYWWHWDINKVGSFFRIVMVFIDYFLLTLISFKVFNIVVFIYKLGVNKLVFYNYYDQFSLGSLSEITNLVGIIILFFSTIGVISLTAWFFHKKHTKYKFTDKFFWWFYPLILIAMFYGSLYPLHKIMMNEKINLITSNNKLVKITNDLLEKNLHITQKGLINDNEVNAEISYLNILLNKHNYYVQLREWPFGTKTISIVFFYIFFPFIVSLIIQFVNPKINLSKPISIKEKAILP